MPSNRLLNYVYKMLNWWMHTRNTAESQFDQKRWLEKSSIWAILNGTAVEDWRLITSSTSHSLTSNPTQSIQHPQPDIGHHTAMLLSPWWHHSDLAQWQPQITNSVMWHRDQWRDSDLWLVDFQASSDEMQKMYSNMNLELNVALKCITIILNGAKDLVRVHANKSKEIV
jgi:hypothetical protein